MNGLNFIRHAGQRHGAKKKRPRYSRDRFLRKYSWLSFDLGHVRGNALPFTAAVHPGVGKQKRAIERFAVLAGSDFAGAAGDNRDVRTVHFNVELLVFRGLVSVFVALGFASDVRSTDEFIL